MVCKKQGVDLVIKPNQAAASARREQRPPPPKPVSPLEQGFSSVEDDEERFIPVEDEQEVDLTLEKARDIWRKMGYYDHHPNYNPEIRSETQLKELLQHHDKLGPALKKYKLFLNQTVRMRTLLLQYPNREPDQEYRASNGQKPLELRIKPKCGLVELDIPMNINTNFDKEKGIHYGEALRNSRLLQQGGSYGLAGGLGVGPRPVKDSGRAAPLEGPSTVKLLENFEDSNNKGHVMNKITLGGMIVPFKDGDPIYMTATFKGDICTWTKLDAMVQLRPQFSHIDALHEQDKSMFRQERAHEERVANRPDENEARAVNMAVKSTENNDDLDMYGGMSETAKLLKAMRDEPWQRMTWIDQDEDESYQVYDENLVYKDPGNAPHLVSEMTDKQYLDAISCPRIDPTKQGENVMSGDEFSTGESSTNGKGLEEMNLDDTEEEEEEGILPLGVLRPDVRTQQVRIERICRAICTKPQRQQNTLEANMIQKLRGKSDSTFLFLRDPHHLFYKWRLAENRAGRGIDPDEDFPKWMGG